MPIISAVRKLKQEECCVLEASLDCRASLRKLKKIKVPTLHPTVSALLIIALLRTRTTEFRVLVIDIGL